MLRPAANLTQATFCWKNWLFSRVYKFPGKGRQCRRPVSCQSRKINEHILMNLLFPGEIFFAAILFSVCLNMAAEPVSVCVNTSQPGAEISPKTIGLSYETSLMLPDSKGVHYFRPDNKSLITVFKTLGVKSLRIGGNSVDAPNVPFPSEADIKDFFEFARAAGAKVIYSVRLEDPKSQSITNADL